MDLETLLAESDEVSLHTPLTEETRGLMNEKRIGLMKKNAVLINTARGPVVDSDALAGALKEGRIVFDNVVNYLDGTPRNVIG